MGGGSGAAHRGSWRGEHPRAMTSRWPEQRHEGQLRVTADTAADGPEAVGVGEDFTRREAQLVF